MRAPRLLVLSSILVALVCAVGWPVLTAHAVVVGGSAGVAVGDETAVGVGVAGRATVGVGGGVEVAWSG